MKKPKIKKIVYSVCDIIIIIILAYSAYHMASAVYKAISKKPQIKIEEV